MQSHPDLGPPGELAHGDFEMIVRRLADDLAFGTDTSAFVGSGLEYAQSRPYQPGDSIRQMDWRLTARTGRPFVKEYEALKRTNVYLMIDTSASMSVTSVRLSKHDLAIWIGAAVGLIAQRRLSPVAIVGAGERQTRFEPSLLQSDLWQSLEPLRLGALHEHTCLGLELRSLEVKARRASVIVILSDLHDPEAMEAIRHMTLRHDVLVMHLRDPAECGGLRAGFFRGREAETGHQFLAHGRSIWKSQDPDVDVRGIQQIVARSGASYLSLHTDRAFIPLLRHFLSFRARVGGGRA